MAPGEVTTVTVTVLTGSLGPEGAMPRLSVEGFVGDQLLSGVVIEIVVPHYVAFDGYAHVYLPLAQNDIAGDLGLKSFEDTFQAGAPYAQSRPRAQARSLIIASISIARWPGTAAPERAAAQAGRHQPGRRHDAADRSLNIATSASITV
jgi:hypothetical protein